MIQLNLPSSPDRPLLLSFWLALCVCAWGALTLVSLMIADRTLGLWGALFLSGAGMFGYYRGHLVLVAYRKWWRVTRRVARIAERWTLRVCYFVLFTAAGAVSPSAMRLRPRSSGGSGWERGPTAGNPISYQSLSSDAPAGRWSRGRRWEAQLARWGLSSRNGWVVILIPYLVLLRTFAPPKAEDTAFGRNYTLY